MAKVTTSHDVGTNWVQVALSGQSFIIQNLDDDDLYYAYGATVPAAGAIGHLVGSRASDGDISAVSHVWVRATASTARMAVTTGGTADGTAGAFATTAYDLAGPWVQIAAAGQLVIVDAVSGWPARYAYAATQPPLEGPLYHRLLVGETYADEVTDVPVWGRCEVDTPSARSLIVVTAGVR